MMVEYHLYCEPDHDQVKGKQRELFLEVKNELEISILNEIVMEHDGRWSFEDHLRVLIKLHTVAHINR